MGKQPTFYSELEKEITSCMHPCSIHQGHSSSQTTKSSMWTACWASMWAGVLPCLLVWEKAKVQKPWTLLRIPATTFWTNGTASVRPWIEFWSTNESPSKITSLTWPPSQKRPLSPWPLPRSPAALAESTAFNKALLSPILRRPLLPLPLQPASV